MLWLRILTGLLAWLVVGFVFACYAGAYLAGKKRCYLYPGETALLLLIFAFLVHITFN